MIEPQVDIQIPCLLDSIGLVGRCVWLFTYQVGLDKSDAETFELAVVEATTNVVRHAFDDAKIHSLAVQIRTSNNDIVCTIEDAGKAIPADKWEAAKRSYVSGAGVDIDQLQEGGYGLNLIHQCVDKAVYIAGDEKNTLTLFKQYR